MARFESRWGSAPSQEEKGLLNYVHFMMNKKNPAYALVTFRMNCKKDTETSLTSLTMLPDGTMNLGINFDVFRTIPEEGRVQAVELTVYKILSGALSSLGKDIEKRYGETLSEMGLLMALHDTVTHDFLEQGGFSIPDPRAYGLPEGRTWSFYCEALMDKSNKGELDIKPSSTGDADADGDLDGSIATGANTRDQIDNANQAGQKVLPSSTTNAASGQMSDQQSRSIMEDLRNSPHAKNGQGRGLIPGNATEWIDSLFQEPKISWVDHLRMKESGHARVVTNLF
jgi:hypothetical protein